MKPDFKNNELIPAVVQDFFTRKVLMLAYMNQESFDRTLESGKVTFYSRSRKKIWVKGETSGNYLVYHSHLVDCDGDTLLVFANPEGPTCHLENDTCFGEFKNTGSDLGFLTEIIQDRKANPSESSYTNTLLDNIDKAAQKVGEEAVELVIESKDDRPDRFAEEAADLLYHYLVLLSAKDRTLEEVIEVLKKRIR